MKTSCLPAFPFGMNYPCRSCAASSGLLTVSLSSAPPGTHPFRHWTVILLCCLRSLRPCTLRREANPSPRAGKGTGRAFKERVVRGPSVFLESKSRLFFCKCSRQNRLLLLLCCVLGAHNKSLRCDMGCRHGTLCGYTMQAAMGVLTAPGTFPDPILEKRTSCVVCTPLHSAHR